MAQPGAQPPPGAMPMPMPPGAPPGAMQLTPEQVQELQRRFLQEAERLGITPQELAQRVALQQRQMMEAQARAQAAGAGGSAAASPSASTQPGSPQSPQQSSAPQSPQSPQSASSTQSGQIRIPMGMHQQQSKPAEPGPPRPEAIAIAQFLQSQNLKTRPCVLHGERRELFKVKRAIRALQSPAYENARKKNALLPEVTDRVSAENVFKMLPMSQLAIRVTKFDAANNPAHGQPGHQHGAGSKQKGQKGIWTVQIVQHQEATDYCYYVWFYQGPQWRQKIYAALALVAVMAVVLFPLWPYTLRIGVWYLSMACLGLLGAFFGLAIVRLILFVISLGVLPPGIWLYPNLFEDVGFFDSFKPLWAWRETKESLAAKKQAKKAKKQAKREKRAAAAGGAGAPGKKGHSHSHTHGDDTPASASASEAAPSPSSPASPDSGAEKNIVSQPGTTGAQPAAGQGQVTARRNLHASVEEEADDESEE